MRVLVVGAGLAGLTAALDLSAAGVDVTVLEAGRRSGGRVRTTRAPFVGGQHAESGAEWVDSHHTRMLDLLARYGLALEGEGTQWTTLRRWLHVGGDLLDGAQVERRYRVGEAIEAYDDLVATFADGIADPGDPVAHPDAAAIDALSIADLLERVPMDPVARLLVERGVQGEFAAEARDVSALFLAQQRAVVREAKGPVRAHRVLGGLDQLTARLASEVRDVRLGARVGALEHGDAGVVVKTLDGDALVADHVVLTCSLVALRGVSIEPVLPEPLAAAVAELGYGTVTKTAVQYPERVWPPGYLTSDAAFQRAYEPTADQPGAHGILLSYRGGDGARTAPAREAERLSEVDRLWRGMVPSLGARLGGFSRAWHEHDRFGGAYAVYRPGQVTAHWRVLRRPHGRVWLAGEHAATVTGYMEGAVESGQRVAASIISVG